MTYSRRQRGFLQFNVLKRLQRFLIAAAVIYGFAAAVTLAPSLERSFGGGYLLAALTALAMLYRVRQARRQEEAYGVPELLSPVDSEDALSSDHKVRSIQAGALFFGELAWEGQVVLGSLPLYYIGVGAIFGTDFMGIFGVPGLGEHLVVPTLFLFAAYTCAMVGLRLRDAFLSIERLIVESQGIV